MSAADDNPQPLACFASLPYELRAKVVSMAYSCDPYFPWLPPGFAQSLALVSRDVHSIITPILYKHVRLERPSKLRSFLSTLVARPALGRLVKSLHLGAACHLHHEWWPLNFFGAADDEVELEEITTSSYDKGKLPRWTELDRGWSFVQPETDAGLKQRDKAVLSAIKVAQRELNITLQSPHVVLNREENGQLLWLIGVLEIQAVLDLYLYEMRRLEDAAGLYMTPRNGSVPVEDEISLESPPLVLEWTSPPAASSSKTSPSPTGSLGQPKPFVISRTRLLQHLYRPGGPADCFDHPLIFARSGMQVLDFDLAGQARSSDKFLAQMTSLCYDDADKGSSDAAPFALPRAAGAVPYAPDLTVALDVAANGTFTVGGILALARSLLALTPRVENLFLSGFLQAAFCGTEAAFVPSLRWLCLGPLSLFSDESFPPSLLDGSRFPNLEHVRFMGSGFDERKRACIATLPRLETVEWAMENSIEPDERVVEALKPLVEPATFAPVSERREERGRKRKYYEDEDEDGFAEDESAILEEEEMSSTVGLHRRPPTVLAVVSWSCLDVLEGLLTEKAIRARGGGRLLSRRPQRLILWASEAGGHEEDRWDGGSSDIILAYYLLSDWWTECLTGKSRWDRED